MATGRNDIGFFETPIIRKLNFEVNQDFLGEFSGEVRTDLSINTKKVQEIEEDVFLFISKLGLRIGEKSNSFPFYCELEIEGKFYRDESSDIDEEDFAKRNTAAILYSYARPIISDTITKSGFPPYNLPFMNFTTVDLKNEDN